MDGVIKKVIVIGLDGLEPAIVSRLLEANQLPNLARLKEQGGFARVATTRPAQTPVAWSTFATGANPGGHGIFDFLRRNPKNYLPELALNRYEQKNAFLPPKAVNLRRGMPIWELLAAAGKSSTVLRCPCTYPPDRCRGTMLSGMGVPDLRGGLGTATFYTSNDAVTPRESEQVVRPQQAGEGVFTTHLIGPRNPKGGGDLRIDVTLRIDPEGRRIILQSDGTPRELEIRQGQWSDWLRVKFKVGLLQSIRGMVRFYLARMRTGTCPVCLAGQLRSSRSPLSDQRPARVRRRARPARSAFTTRPAWSKTMRGLTTSAFPRQPFLDQCEIVWREREAMMLHELDSFDEGFFYCLFDTPDRIQHLFWRYHRARSPGQPRRGPQCRFRRR